MSIQPHPSLAYWRPDQIAECCNGVLDSNAPTEDLKWSLYNALWKSMDDMKPLGELIDMENSAPQDAIGLNTTLSVWDKFSDEQKLRLNAIMEAQQKEMEE